MPLPITFDGVLVRTDIPVVGLSLNKLVVKNDTGTTDTVVTGTHFLNLLKVQSSSLEGC